METKTEVDDFAVAVAKMSRRLLARETVQDTLDEIVRHAVELIDGCEHAGVLVLEDRTRVRTLAASSELVVESDRLQEELGEGPCFDAARTPEEVYRIRDLGEGGSRWPAYAPRARKLGLGSVMGFLLFTEDGSMGALDIYSTRPGAFTERSETVGWVIASHAAVALSSARATAQLNEALITRNEIGEAMGILMERYKIAEDEAFQLLRHSSQRQNVKLREIARTVVHNGELPGARV